MYGDTKPGVCECKLCGLRGYSKNVTCRSVFPIFPNHYLEMYDGLISARWNDEVDPPQYLFGSRAKRWSGGDKESHKSLADMLIDYLKMPDTKPEDFRILLCVHSWVQDPGTETV